MLHILPAYQGSDRSIEDRWEKLFLNPLATIWKGSLKYRVERNKTLKLSNPVDTIIDNIEDVRRLQRFKRKPEIHYRGKLLCMLVLVFVIVIIPSVQITNNPNIFFPVLAWNYCFTHSKNPDFFPKSFLHKGLASH